MSRFTVFKKSTRNENNQNKFKNDDIKKNSRWDNLKTDEESFSKDSNNFSNKSNFKGRWRNKRIYKSNMSKDELDKKMALRGSIQMGISFDDIVTKKKTRTKKSSEKTKQLDKLLGTPSSDSMSLTASS